VSDSGHLPGGTWQFPGICVDGWGPRRHHAVMLRVAIHHVRPAHVDDLREWLQTVNGPRRDEALATLVDETCTHEQAFLIEGKEGPVVVYVMEVADVERSRRAPERSSHPIDVDHRRVMQLALGDAVPSELLLDLH
jgi:Family of unknown function (DUF6176)